MPCRDSPKYVILGAGISGLSLAWFLKKSQPNCHIIIVEKKDKVGGFLQTDHIDNFLFERGPHSLRLNDQTALACYELFEDLNLTHSLLKAAPLSKSRYIFYDKKLHPVSFSFSTLAHFKNWKRLTWPLVKNLLWYNNDHQEDLSIDDYFRTQFNDYITDYFINPLTCGIYGGDITKLSFKSCFPQIEHLSRNPKPLIRQLLAKNKKQVYLPLSFKKGMSELIQALEEKLNIDYFLNTTTLKINSNSASLTLANQDLIQADHIFSTLPAHFLAPLLDQLPQSSSTFLSSISLLSYKIVHLGYHTFLKKAKGFGCISPSWSHEPISGIIFDSDIFPDQNTHTGQTRLTLMIKEDSPLFELDGKKLETQVIEETCKILGISDTPDYFNVLALPHAIAQYTVGHQKKLKQLEKDISEVYPKLSFCGSSFYGVSIPSCIAKAKEISVSFLGSLNGSFCI